MEKRSNRFFASKQIKVTYVHNDTYTFDIGIYGGERLNVPERMMQ